MTGFGEYALETLEIVEIVSFTPESGDPWLACGSRRCYVTGI